MAFNNIGSGTLAPGFENRIRCAVNFNGEDFGAQHLVAHPESPGSEIIVLDQGKERAHDGQIYYWSTLWNKSQVATAFSMQGGGFA
jgi:hypothetical protein